ncbi:uncharacterized protein si:dkey-1h6.8 [Myxocyprinus asiaticus]|uniref:uncharacterized protein si:dkey-1h6.8 n=1 Tax=Myxocyprinus asiaticus TaxID=70543 RepID=UPI0022221BF3|nr:uncharacterized protein si:dkey-1h6.8 [Myxocyprinus asiaticus]
MSTQENEFPDCQERVGLKRKLTGPPRLLLGKSKSREKSDRKSQRRQRRGICFDDTPDNNDLQQQDNNGKGDESSHITHHSPQEASEEKETQRDVQGETLGIGITLEKNEGKEENVENKTGMTRSTSKTTIKRTFSSLLRCGVRKRKKSHISYAEDRVENKIVSPQETKKNSHARKKAQDNMGSSMHENKLCEANSKEANGKGKRKVFFTVWPSCKRSSVTSSVNLERGCEEQDDNMVFQEIMSPKGLPFKKLYHIFPRRKKAQPPVNQFECSAPKTSQNKEVGDQLNQLSTDVMDIPITHNEEYQKEEQVIKESCAETFTFSAEVSINTNIGSSNINDKLEICPDQDESKIVLSTMNEKQHQLLESTTEVSQTCGLLDCSSGNFDSELPGTSSCIAGNDMLTLNNTDQEKPIENDMKCRPVITIERTYSLEEENLEASVNEALQFDVLSRGLTMNGSWQHLQINSITNNTLHPSDLSVYSEIDHSQRNETLLIQTAISMVQAAIRGALEQLTIEQQHNQISLDHA